MILVREARGFARGTWGIPKGGVEPDESPDEAARREAREETGVDVRGELISLGSVRHERPCGRTHAYATPVPPGIRPTPTRPEVDGARFFALADARRLICPDQRLLIRRLADLLRAPASRSRGVSIPAEP